MISIPAFREEGDYVGSSGLQLLFISIPAFREEGDWLASSVSSSFFLFQSPPSVRKATGMLPIQTACFPCISIPAFREEGDQNSFGLGIGWADFNPRLP